MTPFARIENGRMFDYATGKWSPAGFKNYLSGTWTDGALSADVTIAVGDRDPVLGRSPLQIAREGWGEQRSQYGGANPALSGPASSRYHLWFAVPEAQAAAGSNAANNDLFVNSKVRIDTSIAGLTQLAGAQQPQWLKQALRKIDADLQSFFLVRPTLDSTTQAHRLAAIYKQWIELRARVVAEPLSAENKNNLLFELDAKSGQFQSALAQLLGLELSAFRASSGSGSTGGIAGRGASADETQRSVAPGEELRVRVHTAQDGDSAKLNFVWLKSRSGSDWKIDPPSVASETGDSYFTLYVSEDAQPTEPYFTRPSIEQPWYDIADSSLRGESFAPWSLEAWAEFTFDDQPIRLGQVVQTLARVPGRGGVYEPLIVTPAVGLSMEPESVLLPEEDGRALEVSVHVHAQKAASGTIRLHLPEGWRSEPAESPFALKTSGESEPIRFRIYPASSWRAVRDGSYTISAEAAVAGRSYATGWRSIGYPGLRPYNHYRAAQLHALKADVKIAPGLSVACVMGTGDEVPAAIESLGVKPHLLTDTELRTADLKQWKVIVVGIRAYTVRPALSAVEGRLEEFVRGGGNLIVQYQDRDFPAPAALKLGSSPEKVVEESAPVKLLEAQNSLLSWPNKITTQDFDGWVEERGHSFLASWGSEFTALTETADQGQDPQRGGLVVGHFGKGSYVYVAYALHRQLPQLVPGSYRLLANLLSAAEKEQ